MFVLHMIFSYFIGTLVLGLARAADVIEYVGPGNAWIYNMQSDTEVGIHKSCNASESIMLQKGLSEMKLLAQISKDHILHYGHNSSIVRKFFGESGNLAEVAGLYDFVLSGSKKDVLLRCDDIDNNCRQAGWAGHWRGSNATQETVICPLSYEIRQPLEQMCMRGYTTSDPAFSAAYFFGQDLLHRMFHVPRVSNELVHHYADSYLECIDLARDNATYATQNSHSLQYFAVEVFAYELVLPGVGCPGVGQAYSDSELATTASTSEIPMTSTTSATNGCTAHEDHWHCPPGVPVPTTSPQKRR